MDGDDGGVVSAERGCDWTRPGHWYSLQVSGERPTPRVGHTATYLPHRAQVILIGGASPDALYDEAWRLDCAGLEMTRIHLPDDCQFPPRYEHGALRSPIATTDANNVEAPNDTNANDTKVTNGSCGDRIWVFAGANMLGNLSDLWELEMGCEEEKNGGQASWRLLCCSGDTPSPRTLHTATARIGDSLTLFGGGLQAASPVDDTSVYQLDASTKTWSVRLCSGTPPSPRQGHVLVAVQDKLLVHGGMAGNTFFSDLYVLSETGVWQAVPETDPNPGKRAGHGCVLYKKWMYIWGGLGPHGSLSDMWRLDTDSLVWEEVCAGGTSPKPRLDFAIAVVSLPVHLSNSAPSNGKSNGESSEMSEREPDGEPNGIEEEDSVPFILVHGGMDDQGSIYDDFHVFRLES